VVLSQSNYAINGDEEACEVLIALVGVPVIGLCYSALGETRSVKERPRTRPSRLCAGGSATSSLWNDGPTAIRGVHERTRLEITTVSDRPNCSRMMRRGGLQQHREAARATTPSGPVLISAIGGKADIAN
jgi:hypothetical protein